MSQDASYAVKKHSACDECRSRKLKCSGEPSGCSRCVKDALPCRYSEQKQMGRPKKRLRDARDPFGDIDAGWVLDPDTDSSLLPQGLSDFGTELPPSVGSSGEGHHQPENEATGSSGMEYPSDLSGLLSSRQFELPSNYNNLPQFSQG
ncbi:MAG: hypothetical protein M4579_006473 [Chaenotheca gracillima]|nr:MAG: hypothetical protein M4579_006473 [Chaenotheca gracillima]